MKEVNALAIRKSLGAVLDQLERFGQPVLVTRDRKPAAVLVPYELFKQRFVDFLSQQEVDSAMHLLQELQSPKKDTADSLVDLRKLRSGIL